MTTLIGYDAIEYAEREDLPLKRFNDEDGPARENLSIEEALEIAEYNEEAIYIDFED